MDFSNFLFFKIREKEPKLWGAFLLSSAFFLITAFFAQRSSDLWAAFGVIFLALVYPHVKKFRIWLYASVVIVFFMAGQSLYKNGELLELSGWSTERFRSAAEWLKENSNEGDIVFNVSWDYFPEIFFWNAKNFYISGMDPIFQFSFDPELYWEAYYLETGKTTDRTCPDLSCEKGELKDTYFALKEDFAAKYVLLDKSYDGALYQYFLRDNRFRLRNENQNAALFEI